MRYHSNFDRSRLLACAYGLGVTMFGLAASTPALAADVTSKTAPALAATAVTAYWTPERIANAKPLILTARGASASAAAAAPSGPSISVPGAFPTVARGSAAGVQLRSPTAGETESGIAPTGIGTGGLPFLTNRAYPFWKTYDTPPYATFGKLYFSTAGGSGYCSASVIRKRVIVTAGHCVSDGFGHFYSNFLFCPAYSAGSTPFVCFAWQTVYVTNNWHLGGGEASLPNRQDTSVIVLNDAFYNGATRRVGDITGTLGYRTNHAVPDVVAQIGYPSNLDGGERPIINYAQTRAASNNNYEWGSILGPGASGGPVVINFGYRPAGVPGNVYSLYNLVIAATSYWYGITYRVDGASTFANAGQFAGGTFGDLINSACATAGNC